MGKTASRPRNRGDCGAISRRAIHCQARLTPPGIAATAASVGRCAEGNQSASRPRNRGDCGCFLAVLNPAPAVTASRPPESRRLRRSDLSRLPFHAERILSASRPRNRGACGRGAGLHGTCEAMNLRSRLTPPGIAAPAAGALSGRPRNRWPASRPPESRRLRR